MSISFLCLCAIGDCAIASADSPNSVISVCRWRGGRPRGHTITDCNGGSWRVNFNFHPDQVQAFEKLPRRIWKHFFYCIRPRFCSGAGGERMCRVMVTSSGPFLSDQWRDLQVMYIKESNRYAGNK